MHGSQARAVLKTWNANCVICFCVNHTNLGACPVQKHASLPSRLCLNIAVGNNYTLVNIPCPILYSRNEGPDAKHQSNIAIINMSAVRSPRSRLSCSYTIVTDEPKACNSCSVGLGLMLSGGAGGGSGSSACPRSFSSAGTRTLFGTVCCAASM